MLPERWLHNVLRKPLLGWILPTVEEGKMTAKQVIAAVVAASVMSTSVLPTATAYAQDRYRGAYDGVRSYDDYRPYRRYKAFRDEAPRRFKKRRYYDYDDQPARRAKRYRHAPDYAQVRKRKKRKKIQKWIAIGAGILALGIIANAANKKHRHR